MGATGSTNDHISRTQEGIQHLEEEVRIERELWFILTQTPADKITALSPDMLKALASFLKKGFAHIWTALTADDYQDLDLDPVEQIYENRTRRLQTLLENCGLEKVRARKMAIAMLGRNAAFDIDHPSYRHLRYILKARARDMVGIEDFQAAIEGSVNLPDPCSYDPYEYAYQTISWGTY